MIKKKILMVYPKIPSTYWSFEYSLPFIGKKTNFPPLGLLTVAALIPEEYDVKLINTNITPLKDKDIIDADYVFISAMIVQKDSMDEVIKLCRKYNKPVVAGGPHPTVSHQSIKGVDHFVLDEAEITLPLFFKDLKEGKAKKIYRSEAKPDITTTPVPRFDLIDINQYSSMVLQYSRGCPFNCEFCDIIELFGRVPRTKTPEQFTVELQRVYDTGYRGSIFVVDDNFIGNKIEVKKLLRRMIEWQKEKKQPFTFITEGSINLAQDEELMDLMAASRFNMVFVGIETPVEESLILTNKKQNTKMSLLESVHKIQKKGIEVSSGFILGFDNEPENIFDLQIDFIKESAIPTAMVGLMAALPQTQLYRRLEKENRILHETSGNNTHDLELNFIPTMPAEKLIAGYKRVISTIYKPKVYFQRCYDMLMIMPDNFRSSKVKTSLSNILTYGMAFFRSLLLQTFSLHGYYYLKFLAKVLIKKPGAFPKAVQQAIYGYHFFKITEKQINHKMAVLNRFKAYMEKINLSLREKTARVQGLDLKKALREIFTLRKKTLPSIKVKYLTASRYSSHYIENTFKNLEELVQIYASKVTQFLKDKIESIDTSGIKDIIEELNKYRIAVLSKIRNEQPQNHISPQDRLDNLLNTIDKMVFELESYIFKKTVPVTVLE